jgi:hypothetical protein
VNDPERFFGHAKQHLFNNAAYTTANIWISTLIDDGDINYLVACVRPMKPPQDSIPPLGELCKFCAI